MSPMTAWKEKFKVPPSCTLKEALKNQLINEVEYQEWASRHYGLPIMKDDFFEQHPSDVKFLDKIKQKNIANPLAIPCFEWNNILYVVCLEPQEINTDQKTIFFITSLKNMESLWENIESSEKQMPSNEQTLSLSEEQIEQNSQPQKEKELNINREPQKVQKEKTMDIKKKPTIQKMENDNIEFERMSPFKAFMFTVSDLSKAFMNFIAPDQKTSTKRTKSMTLSNIDKNKIKENKGSVQTIIPKSITSEIEESNQNKTTPPKTLKPDIEIPTPIDLDKEQNTPDTDKPSNSAKEEEPMPIALDNEEKPSDTDKPSNSAKEEALMPIALDNEEKPSDTDKPSNSAKEEEPMPIALDNEEKPSDTDESSKSAKEETPMHDVHSTTSSFLILDQKKVTSVDQLSPLRKALEETKHYINSYILFVFKQDSFIPYKWSSNLQKVEKRVPGAIQKPSIFRIVYVSKQPYFGHLAPVLANNSFFNHWGFETLPKHVVVIPFLDDEKQNVLGAYLGISVTRTLPMKFLHAVEQIVRPLSTYYKDGSLLQKVS